MTSPEQNTTHRVLERYLRSQQKRLMAYRLLTWACVSAVISFLSLAVLHLLSFLGLAFSFTLHLSAGLSRFSNFLSVIIGLSFFAFLFLRRRKLLLVDVAEEIEFQSAFFKNRSAWKSELRSAASFLDESPSGDESFKSAHIHRMFLALPEYRMILFPRWTLGLAIAAVMALAVLVPHSHIHQKILLPSSSRPWTLSSFEILWPLPQAAWQSQTGPLGGTRGSLVRFKRPDDGIFQIYSFVRLPNQPLRAVPCSEEFCELRLDASGQFAVGSFWERSAFFPLQVLEDDPPRSNILVKVKGDWSAVTALEILNAKTLDLEVSASDDLSLKSLRLLHKFAEEPDEVLRTWELSSKTFKDEVRLSMEDWKGGEHQIILEPSDHFRTSQSTPLRIVYNDEKTLREKRLKELEAFLAEWVHVLADLIDTKLDRSLSEQLPSRLQSLQFPDFSALNEKNLSSEDALLKAYHKELELLSERLKAWIMSGAPLSQVDDLIARVERQIIYGLTLIFQERTGDLQATADRLSQTQGDLNEMLQKIKDGKLELNSQALEEAFKKLADQLAELQKKVAELPQGPEEAMMNREALEQQADEADSLAKRIEEIKKQAASGDEKGALREMESLLNQLSILSKEMQRGLEQWQQNMDQGAVKQAQDFAKKLEDLKKQEEALNKKTKALKDQMDKIESKDVSVFKPKDAQELKKMQDQMKALSKEQKSITEKFQEATKSFDKGLEGTEFKDFLRGEEAKQLEQQIEGEMIRSEDGLKDQRLFDADSAQKESIELLKKTQESQKQKMQQLQEMNSAAQREARHSPPEKIDIIGTESKSELERRRKILDSKRQKVGEKYQQSHERYFEEMLQR